MKKIAAIGDVHGCIEELKLLYRQLEWKSLDEIWHVGDLVDRGPDSGAVVEFCRNRHIKGVSGNHEAVLLQMAEQKKVNSEDKTRSIKSIRSQADWDYLSQLPHLHVDDELEFVLVHAGLYPNRNIYAQPPKAVSCVQLIHPYRQVGETRWFGTDIKGRSEEQNRSEGWVAWYEVCDHPFTVVYGHTVYREPKVFENTIGIDTGCVFGGSLTAVILPEKEFVSVKALKTYFAKREPF